MGRQVGGNGVCSDCCHGNKVEFQWCIVFKKKKNYNRNHGATVQHSLKKRKKNWCKENLHLVFVFS